MYETINQVSEITRDKLIKFNKFITTIRSNLTIFGHVFNFKMVIYMLFLSAQYECLDVFESLLEMVEFWIGLFILMIVRADSSS